MSTPVILAIDEGTTNAKAVCVDKQGQIVSKGSRPVSLSHPQAGWSEQDPWEIVSAVRGAIAEALSGGDFNVEAIGISNQRESIMIWDRATGQPLSPLVIWQCRRSEALCRELVESELASTIRQKSGLPVDPLFPAAKISVLLDGIENGRQKAAAAELCVGTVDVWLAWQFSGMQSFVTDYSNASRTQLLNIHTQSWDAELLEIFRIPELCLPALSASSAIKGETKGFEGLPDGIPILSQVGDSHAALYGQGGFIPGVIKATYGTGSSLMTPVSFITGDDYRLARTIAWNDGVPTYALEGNITHTGSGVAWMSNTLGIKDMSSYSELAQSCDSHQGVYFVPALSGLGAPHWDTQARGVLCGLSDNATPAVLARAALESVAYQIADVFWLMEEMSGQTLDTLLVDGGPTQNQWLMQYQANLLNRRIARSITAEVSALGAGYLAGRALGWWQDRDELASLERHVEYIEPQAGVNLSEAYEGWKKAVERTCYRP